MHLRQHLSGDRANQRVDLKKEREKSYEENPRRIVMECLWTDYEVFFFFLLLKMNIKEFHKQNR